jgi:hypothetical protein
MLIFLFLLFADQAISLNGIAVEPLSPRNVAPMLSLKNPSKISDGDVSADSTSDTNRRAGGTANGKGKISDTSDNRSVDTDATGSTVSSSYGRSGETATVSNKRNSKGLRTTRVSGAGAVLDSVPEQCSDESVSLNSNAKQILSGLTKVGLEHLLQFCALWSLLWDELPPLSDAAFVNEGKEGMKLSSNKLDSIVERSRRLSCSYVTLLEDLSKQLRGPNLNVAPPNGHGRNHAVAPTAVFPMSLKSFVSLALTASQISPNSDPNMEGESILSAGSLRKSLSLFSVVPPSVQVILNERFAKCQLICVILGARCGQDGTS